jgi:hypothetical protein
MDSELQDILESRIAAEEEVDALLKQFAKVNQLNLYFFTSHKPELGMPLFIKLEKKKQASKFLFG